LNRYYDASNNPLFYNKINKSYDPVSQTIEWKQSQSKRMIGKSTTQGKTWKLKDTTNCGNKGANKGKNWKWNVESSQERNQKLRDYLQGKGHIRLER
jgi:hypothetical protein